MRPGLTRRMLDVAIALLALALSLPLLALVALAIKIDLGSPVLFRQQRVGAGGREFPILKFRTMRPIAYVGQLDHERKTQLGTLLRFLSLDELPQFLNILRGDMSLIGPRPALPEHIPHYTERQLGRLAVRPGLTGWAQVRGRNAFSLPQRIEHDLWYIEHRSWWLDLRIIGATVLCLCWPRNVVGVGGENPTFPAATHEHGATKERETTSSSIPPQNRRRRRADR